MRIPGPVERTTWQLLWGRNPITLAVMGLMPYRAVDRPIFIVGSPRSGTSVFSRLFCQHPNLANWSEGHALFDPFYMIDKSSEHRWTALDSSAYGRRRLRANVSWFQRWIGRRQGIPADRFTNKLPRNTLRIPYLLEAFPDACFIHIIRDGRAVVRSLVRAIDRQGKHDKVLGSFARPTGWQEYYRNDRYEAHSRQWVGIEETVQADLAEVPAERIFRTSYEKFIVDTRQILTEVCRQFDLRTDDEAIARYPEHLENRNVKWPRECTREQIQTMKKWLTSMLINYAYESDPDWPIPDDAGAETNGNPSPPAPIAQAV